MAAGHIRQMRCPAGSDAPARSCRWPPPPRGADRLRDGLVRPASLWLASARTTRCADSLGGPVWCQTAIAITRTPDCEIFATAGGAQRRQLLHDMGVEHVYDSRSTEFARQIESTDGYGVDVVLNSLPPRNVLGSIAGLWRAIREIGPNVTSTATLGSSCSRSAATCRAVCRRLGAADT